MKHGFAAVVFAGLCALAIAFIATPGASAADGMNLKVYPPQTSKADIKKDMKVISKALGVECDFCHDMKDMAKDTKHKEEAREMMRMVQSLNAKELKAHKAVTCQTCHRGHEHPPKAPKP